MTNEQLYLAIGVPLVFNAILIGILIALMNAKFEGLEAKFEARFTGIDGRFTGIEGRFTGIDARFNAIDKRFDDMRDLWRAELRRVEEILDARLKHIEERH